MSQGSLLSGDLESDLFMVLYERVSVIPPKESTPLKVMNSYVYIILQYLVSLQS